MTDRAYRRLPWRLAIAAMAVVVLQSMLFLFSRALAVQFGPAALTVDAYGGVNVLLMLTMQWISCTALAGVTAYTRTQGYLERQGSGRLASPRRLTLAFTVAFLVVSVGADLFLLPHALHWIRSLLDGLSPEISLREKTMLLSPALYMLDFVQVVVCCLLAFAAAVVLARGPAGATRTAAMRLVPDAARIAATAAGLAFYTTLAWQSRLVWQLVIAYVTYYGDEPLGWATLSVLLWPAIPAAIVYTGVRRFLETRQLDHARPARAVAVAVCAFLALLIGETILIFAIVWTHLHLFSLASAWAVLAVFMLLLYLAALAPVCRGFCRLFYRSAPGGQGSGWREQAPTA